MNIRYQTFLDCGRFRRKLFFFQEEKKQDLAHLFVSTFGVQPLIIHSFSWSAALNPPCVANTRVQKRESFFLYTVVKVFSRDLFLCSYVLFPSYFVLRWFIYKWWWFQYWRYISFINIHEILFVFSKDDYAQCKVRLNCIYLANCCLFFQFFFFIYIKLIMKNLRNELY